MTGPGLSSLLIDSVQSSTNCLDTLRAACSIILKVNESSAPTRLTNRKAIGRTEQIPGNAQAGPSQAEIRFLEYRLEVVRLWPDSDRKQAVVEATLHRLSALGWLRPPAIIAKRSSPAMPAHSGRGLAARH